MFLRYSLGCLGWTHRKFSFAESDVPLGEATAGGASPSLGVNEHHPNETTAIPTQHWQQRCCKQSLAKGIPGLPPLPLWAASPPAFQGPGGRWDSGEQRPGPHGAPQGPKPRGRALLRAEASAAAAGPRPACPRQVAAAAAASRPARGPGQAGLGGGKARLQVV